MKNAKFSGAAIALIAALATPACAEPAASRTVNQGRSGYAVLPVPAVQVASANPRRETTVALVVAKPELPAGRFQTMGRSGDRFIYMPERGR
ncbi:hypothetical protein HQ447_04460 [bacterium]|nr:hypothetical protein [bacterium]